MIQSSNKTSASEFATNDAPISAFALDGQVQSTEKKEAIPSQYYSRVKWRSPKVLSSGSCPKELSPTLTIHANCGGMTQ
jgi:hypothetical protein